jgi:hypothetical protein
MEESLTALLLAYSPLTSLVGTNPTRVYWMRAPQNVAEPFVVLQVISSVPDVSHQGPSGLIPARVQADCYSDSYTSAKAVARAVTARLSGYRGTPTPPGTVTFDGVFKDAERDEYEPDDSPDKLFRVSMDFIIWHKGA